MKRFLDKFQANQAVKSFEYEEELNVGFGVLLGGILANFPFFSSVAGKMGFSKRRKVKIEYFNGKFSR